ncbi:MAG: SagB/ThcOx family dehydrogenase [Candidatus Lokiarchaeota archaeon]|nr:SagB/ThcOx family dehydrogenase [Candidatus Lokiarchaeota archaeon]
MEIKLPKPILEGNKSLEECIYERESVRKYQDKAIEIEKISQILWAAQGKKGQKRTVPSAGATYPLEIYVTLKDKGYFHYDFKNHALKLVTEDIIGEKLAEESWNQKFIEEAYLNIIICADYSRTTKRYGERGIRYVHMEVGHCAQNIHLEAIALGLVSVPIGAFQDNNVKKVMKLPANIDPLYIIPIGYP